MTSSRKVEHEARRSILAKLRERPELKPGMRIPCAECPWRRDSFRGWLGAEDGELLGPEVWLERARAEVVVDCHLRPRQCVGLAIFRANICKLPRFAAILVLPKDTDHVFASQDEFLKHHGLYKPND